MSTPLSPLPFAKPSAMTVPASCIAVVTLMVIFLTDLALPTPVQAQVSGAVRRAATRAAVSQSAKRAIPRSAGATGRKQATDQVIRRFTLSLCKQQRPCPLPAREAASFAGGSYNVVRLGRDTRFYRVYSGNASRLGTPGHRYSFWSRSKVTGTQAVIDSALPTARNGNVAARQVSIVVPRGTVIYEGRAGGLPRGPVGGGNQVVLERVRSEWITQP